MNWNGREHLEVCLESLLGQTLPGVEIVLVDNASSDGSVGVRARALRRRRARARARRRTSATRGGLNAGIRAARGRYLLALNSDTEVAPDCLARLVEAADRWPNAGMFAPKILSFDDRSVLDNVGHLLYPDGLSRGRGRLEPDRGQYDREEEIVLPSGCAVLLRRAMLADIGLFDTDLFAYCDDTDLGLRARLAGWRCRCGAGGDRLPQVLGGERAVLAAEGVPGRAQPRLGGGQVPAGCRCCSPARCSPRCASPRRRGARCAARRRRPLRQRPLRRPRCSACSAARRRSPPCAACRRRGRSGAPTAAAGRRVPASGLDRLAAALRHGQCARSR